MANDNLVPQPDDSILRAVNNALGDERTAETVVRNPAATGQIIKAAESNGRLSASATGGKDAASATSESTLAAQDAPISAAADDVQAQARKIAADHQKGEIPLTAVDAIGRATAQDVKEALHQVIDPELGVDVIDLGLVYGIEIDNLGRAIITMTLTTPACPLTGLIEDECASVLAGLVEEFRIDWTWTPPWNVSMMTQEGADQMAALGFNPGNLPKY
ncbi:MAG: metal-sulfur cluster assembly factor [Bifidobacteriaceae bacterium]|nr:metal-sulfur cluster assembly factor [Bifidobacteriaceae bacterium]